jgi:hypothetical protein
MLHSLSSVHLAEHYMFVKQLILAATRLLNAAARLLLEACTRKHGLPLREQGRASRSIARLSRGMVSFEVMAARAASGA